MRIVFAGQTYLPSTNGPAVFTTNLAESLARRGHRVLAVVPSPSGSWRRERRNGVMVVSLPAIVSRRTEVAVTAFPNAVIGRLLDAFRPDAIHIQDHYPTSRAVLRESRRRGLAVVGTNHFVPGNLALQLPLPGVAHGAVEQLLWWTVSSVYRRLDAVTAPSRTAAELLRPHLRGRDVLAISCGVDVERFRPRPAEERCRLRARLGLPDGASAALYVGRLDRDKNVELLLRALARSAAPDLLLVAGKGLWLDRLEALARDLGLAGRTRFLGYVPDAALPDLYAASDLFVMPGAVELLSIATLEAMASGLPVAAARAGALPELVVEGVHGRLFGPEDAQEAAGALESLSRAGVREAMAPAVRERAEEHRVERTRARFEALYREVAAAPSRR